MTKKSAYEEIFGVVPPRRTETITQLKARHKREKRESDRLSNLLEKRQVADRKNARLWIDGKITENEYYKRQRALFARYDKLAGT